MSTSGKSFDASAVSRATWIAAGGALILFISVFLSWYTASVHGLGVSASGAAGTGSLAKLVALLALIALAALVIELFGTHGHAPAARVADRDGCGWPLGPLHPDQVRRQARGRWRRRVDQSRLGDLRRAHRGGGHRGRWLSEDARGVASSLRARTLRCARPSHIVDVVNDMRG